MHKFEILCLMPYFGTIGLDVSGECHMQCFESTHQTQWFKIRCQTQHFKIFCQTQFSVAMIVSDMYHELHTLFSKRNVPLIHPFSLMTLCQGQ